MTEGPPPLKERRRIAREEMKDAILAVSRQIMREAGASGLTLAEVSRRLGVQPPSLYEYFPSKAAVYDALYAEAFREFEVRMQPVLEAEIPLWDVLRKAMETYMRFAQQSPELFEIGFLGAGLEFAPSEASAAVRRRALEGVRASFEPHWQGIETEHELDSVQIMDLFGATAHGLAALQLAIDPGGGVEEGRFKGLIPALVEIFRRAWSVDGARRPPQNAWGISV